MTDHLMQGDEYEENSPEAVLRCAVAIACADREFAIDEQARVESVYSDICEQMGYQYNTPKVSDQYEKIASSTAKLMQVLQSREEREEYFLECSESIIDTDLQELALIMALRVAGGDAELADDEYDALRIICNHWDINLHDVLQPYLRM